MAVISCMISCGPLCVDKLLLCDVIDSVATCVGATATNCLGGNYPKHNYHHKSQSFQVDLDCSSRFSSLRAFILFNATVERLEQVDYDRRQTLRPHVVVC